MLLAIDFLTDGVNRGKQDPTVEYLLDLLVAPFRQDSRGRWH
jgi:hypothetical protein